ncbi:MAG: peptide ABC transporter substrate-binding protein [Pseudomonadota bacterium]
MFPKFAVTGALAALLCTSAIAGGHATHPETGEALAEDQTLTYRIGDGIPTLDPQLIEDTTSFHVARQLYEGLVTQDLDGSILPGVAESWEASNGNLTWTFTLREDAKWSNGDPVTSADFIAGWTRAMDPATASPYAWYLELTSIVNAKEVLAGEADVSTLGVSAPDDYTLVVNLTAPLPYFPSMMSFATLFPIHMATVEAHGADWTKPENMVNNGAYNLASRVVGERIELVKSDTYWDAENTIITDITGLVINDANQALTRWKAGELDYMDDLPPGQFPALQAEYPEETFSSPRLCSYYYAMNQTESGHPSLQDERVRLALSLAIDRDVIVDQVLKGGQTAAYNFTHYATAGLTMPEIEVASLSQGERDAMAKALWSEAMGDETPTYKLIYNTSESHKAIATVVSQMWKQKLGVSTELANFEWKTYLGIRGEQQFDIARSAWCGDYNEASTFLDLLTSTHSSNDGKYSNARVDELMAASKTADDPQPLYTEVEQIAMGEAGIAPIYHYANTFLLHEGYKGWAAENVENNWYVKDQYRVATD